MTAAQLYGLLVVEGIIVLMALVAWFVGRKNPG